MLMSWPEPRMRYALGRHASVIHSAISCTPVVHHLQQGHHCRQSSIPDARHERRIDSQVVEGLSCFSLAARIGSVLRTLLPSASKASGQTSMHTVSAGASAP